MLTLVLGGARSGKSRFAQQLAAQASRVAYLATAQPHQDPEMIERIQLHSANRPRSWWTIEEPLELAYTVENAAKQADVILVECLTIWLSNVFWQYRDNTSRYVEDHVRAQLDRICGASSQCDVILVSNELGFGTVPDAAITRAFRDTHGLLNQWAAAAADEVILTVAGLPLYLKSAPRRSGNDLPV